IYLYTSIKPKTIRYSNKKRVDYDKLFDEFRKILNRELTKDEKKIINLAYNMGKTNQFTLENVKQRKNK
ncbi:exonuclease, partial [Clostridioides difficile]|nr:exonuclease [Clostridioides difficile]